MEFIEERESGLNTQAYELLARLETLMKREIRSALERAYPPEGLRGVPRESYKSAVTRMAEKNYDAPAGREVDLWDCFYFVDFQKIFRMSGTQWRELFEKRFTLPGDEKLKWESKSSWVGDVNSIRNKTMHNQPVTPEELALVQHVVEALGA